jgi:hypothetical protein
MAIKPLDWEHAIGQRCRIYRNLNNGTMSLQLKVKGWYVAGHVTDAIVQDVKFHLSEASRLRVIRDGRKNVHAWGEGLLIAQFKPEIAAPIDLSYNPYEDTTFVERGTKRPIANCQYLVVRDNAVFVSLDALPAPSPEPALNLLTFPQRPVAIRQYPSQHRGLAA